MILTPPVRPSYPLGRWDLSALCAVPTEEVIAARFAALEAEVAAFEARRPGLQPAMDSSRFLAALRHHEATLQQLNELSSFAALWFYEDTGNTEALTFRNRVRQTFTAAFNRILFFDLWWKSLDDSHAAQLLTSDVTADERHSLEELRRTRPYSLDERSEQIINLKDDNGVQAVTTLYSMLTNRMEFRLQIDGETKTLTRDALLAYAYSPRADLRAAAYRELYRVYAAEAPILGQIYVNRVRDWHDENVGLRGFASPIAVRNIDNDVPDRAVAALLAVVRANAPLFQRFFRWKAGGLGIDRLRRYDLYAPLAAADREVSYEDAVRQVLETFDSFHPLFARQAERVFAERHIDSELRKGKRSGAFCSTVGPRHTPWVLVNFAGKVRDVATLAHELGHAVHSMLAEGHSYLTQHSSLPLAETASVFGEMLITDRLLREERDPLLRRELLATAVDDVYATVLRQSFFVLFEIEAHQAILAGQSNEELNTIYMRLLAEQFGDSVEISPEFQYEWLCIPHFYNTPFYCYAYSFGQLLVLALYRRFEEEGEAFKPGYLKLLSYGGSARPHRILAEMGIDITDAAFWQGGFAWVRERIEELERLYPAAGAAATTAAVKLEPAGSSR